MNIIFGSGGNDSVALFQWAIENGVKDIHVAYSNTGWAADWWPERINKWANYILSNGAIFHEIESEGMQNLIFRKKAWPTNGIHFCSYELKIKPALEWLEIIDPDKEATCLVGIRRCESSKRANWPEYVEESPNHGGRSLHAPMVRFDDSKRNELILKSGFEVLPHRSMECFPCVDANRNDILMLDENRISLIEKLETEMGYTKNNKARTMFRPAKVKGATGIRQVVEWASRDNFIPGMNDLFCDSGYCGS